MPNEALVQEQETHSISDPTLFIGVELEFVADWLKIYKIVNNTSSSAGFDDWMYNNSFRSLATWMSEQSGYDFTCGGWNSGKRTSKNWEVKPDGSIDSSLELCTQPGTPRFILSRLKRVLGFISPFVEVSDRCGMHVHMSLSRRSPNCLDFRAFSERVIEKYNDHPWPEREEFCRPIVETESMRDYSKYYMVHLIRDNHIEVRAFNGTDDIREIKERIHSLVELYNASLVEQAVAA